MQRGGPFENERPQMKKGTGRREENEKVGHAQKRKQYEGKEKGTVKRREKPSPQSGKQGALGGA